MKRGGEIQAALFRALFNADFRSFLFELDEILLAMWSSSSGGQKVSTWWEIELSSYHEYLMLELFKRHEAKHSIRSREPHVKVDVTLHPGAVAPTSLASAWEDVGTSLGASVQFSVRGALHKAYRLVQQGPHDTTFASAPGAPPSSTVSVRETSLPNGSLDFREDLNGITPERKNDCVMTLPPMPTVDPPIAAPTALQSSSSEKKHDRKGDKGHSRSESLKKGRKHDRSGGYSHSAAYPHWVEKKEGVPQNTSAPAMSSTAPINGMPLSPQSEKLTHCDDQGSTTRPKQLNTPSTDPGNTATSPTVASEGGTKWPCSKLPWRNQSKDDRKEQSLSPHPSAPSQTKYPPDPLAVSTTSSVCDSGTRTSPEARQSPRINPTPCDTSVADSPVCSEPRADWAAQEPTPTGAVRILSRNVSQKPEPQKNVAPMSQEELEQMHQKKMEHYEEARKRIFEGEATRQHAQTDKTNLSKTDVSDAGYVRSRNLVKDALTVAKTPPLQPSMPRHFPAKTTIGKSEQKSVTPASPEWTSAGAPKNMPSHHTLPPPQMNVNNHLSATSHSNDLSTVASDVASSSAVSSAVPHLQNTTNGCGHPYAQNMAPMYNMNPMNTGMQPSMMQVPAGNSMGSMGSRMLPTAPISDSKGGPGSQQQQQMAQQGMYMNHMIMDPHMQQLHMQQLHMQHQQQMQMDYAYYVNSCNMRNDMLHGEPNNVAHNGTHSGAMQTQQMAAPNPSSASMPVHMQQQPQAPQPQPQQQPNGPMTPHTASPAPSSASHTTMGAMSQMMPQQQHMQMQPGMQGISSSDMNGINMQMGGVHGLSGHMGMMEEGWQRNRAWSAIGDGSHHGQMDGSHHMTEGHHNMNDGVHHPPSMSDGSHHGTMEGHHAPMDGNMGMSSMQNNWQYHQAWQPWR